MERLAHVLKSSKVDILFKAEGRANDMMQELRDLLIKERAPFNE